MSLETKLLNYLQLVPPAELMRNPYRFWGVYERNHPEIADLSQSYLAFDAGVAPTEGTWSMLHATVTPRRSSLSPALSEALVFLRKNKHIALDYWKSIGKSLSDIKVSPEQVKQFGVRIREFNNSSDASTDQEEEENIEAAMME
jgi:hypothetical protein